jgi:hypothetical protein
VTAPGFFTAGTPAIISISAPQTKINCTPDKAGDPH